MCDSKKVTEKMIDFEQEHKGILVSFSSEVFLCEDCGYHFSTLKQKKKEIEALKQAYATLVYGKN